MTLVAVAPARAAVAIALVVFPLLGLACGAGRLALDVREVAEELLVLFGWYFLRLALEAEQKVGTDQDAAYPQLETGLKAAFLRPVAV